MELYVFERYRQMFPRMKGACLTDRLIRAALEEAGLSLGERRILRTDKGKPYLEGGGVHFSVSHSGDYFVCLLAEEPVGVDVQKGRRAGWEKIAGRYFTEEEQAYLTRRGEAGFFRLWTRKEAYAKYRGTGLEEILKGASVLCREDVEFIEFQLEEGIWCACCMEKKRPKK